MFDIAIIGAGHAGATLARFVAGQYNVLLVDKRPLDGMEQGHLARKCCGGLLAPDAQAMLSKLIYHEPQISFHLRSTDQKDRDENRIR